MAMNEMRFPVCRTLGPLRTTRLPSGVALSTLHCTSPWCRRDVKMGHDDDDDKDTKTSLVVRMERIEWRRQRRGRDTYCTTRREIDTIYLHEGGSFRSIKCEDDQEKKRERPTRWKKSILG